MATKQRKSVQKKTRRKVQRGVVHILATFNNTLVTLVIVRVLSLLHLRLGHAVSVVHVKELRLQHKQLQKKRYVKQWIMVLNMLK